MIGGGLAWAGFLLTYPFTGGAMLLAWGTCAVLASAAVLGGTATALDGVAGMAPRALEWVYVLAFLLAMLAWMLGILFIGLLFVLSLFAHDLGSIFQPGLEGYADLKPKLRATA